jgi:hypothetical protein
MHKNTPTLREPDSALEKYAFFILSTDIFLQKFKIKSLHCVTSVLAAIVVLV